MEKIADVLAYTLFSIFIIVAMLCTGGSAKEIWKVFGAAIVAVVVSNILFILV